VVPVRAAAGLQNKLLEALAMARAVVATPEANEGIRAEPGRDLLLAREPDAFARAVLDLLADPARRAALGAAGRRFVEERWTWEGPFLGWRRRSTRRSRRRGGRAAGARAAAGGGGGRAASPAADSPGAVASPVAPSWRPPAAARRSLPLGRRWSSRG
jgi:hypothetical protein